MLFVIFITIKYRLSKNYLENIKNREKIISAPNPIFQKKLQLKFWSSFYTTMCIYVCDHLY